jgi:hypothetical protein
MGLAPQLWRVPYTFISVSPNRVHARTSSCDGTPRFTAFALADPTEPDTTPPNTVKTTFGTTLSPVVRSLGVPKTDVRRGTLAAVRRDLL